MIQYINEEKRILDKSKALFENILLKELEILLFKGKVNMTPTFDNFFDITCSELILKFKDFVIKLKVDYQESVFDTGLCRIDFEQLHKFVESNEVGCSFGYKKQNIEKIEIYGTREEEQSWDNYKIEHYKNKGVLESNVFTCSHR